MSRLPLRTAIAVVLLTGAAPVSAIAANNNADSIYKYPAYGEQGSPASGADQPINRPPVDPSYEEGAPAPDAGDDQPADDPRDAAPYPAEDDSDLRASGPPPRRATPVPPPRSGDRRRITATASAPDRSIPYDVRAQDARRAAIAAWREKAARRFGPEFSHWRIAAHRRVNCRPARRDDVICTVSGSPVRGNRR
jgi:hypothetical protein